MLKFFEISLLINAIFSFGLGFFVLYKNKHSLLNKLWFFVSFSIGTWALGISRIVVADSYRVAWFWNWFLYSGAIFIPVFYFHFVVVFLRFKNNKIKYLLFQGYFLSIFFWFSNFTRYFVVDVPPVFIFKHWVSPGILYYPYFLYFSIYLLLSISFLIKGFLKSTGPGKLQIKYVLISAIIGVSGGVTLFFPQFFGVFPFGSYFNILYLVGVTYAIARYRLMDIRVVLRASSVFIASLLSIIAPVLLVKYICWYYFQITSDWIDYFFLVFGISFFPAIRNYYYKFANKYFFSSLYDSQEVISTLSDKMQSTLEVYKIYNFLKDTFKTTFHTKATGVLIYNDERKEYIVQYNYQHDLDKFLRFGTYEKYKYRGIHINSHLQKKYLDMNAPIVVDEIKQKEYVRNRTTIESLRAAGIEVAVPLNIKGKTIGLIVLSRKESGDAYNDEDLRILKLIGGQTAIALENSFLYQETKDFNAKLEREIKKATKELVDANNKLMELDKAKSEFISIASHQLRTPLTVIKGYISMILENSFGKLEDCKRDPLEKVYKSNERLIELVENLLNISRIESGRLQYNYRDMYLDDLIESVVEELESTAKKKNLKFIYHKKKGKMPKVRIDEEKMRQVVMNLIDNSIKYTKKGKVEVALSREKNKIKFCVWDTGIGISAKDLPNLFKKFSRGTGTSLIDTEGTGLGLFVAKQMVEIHKGKVWAESEGEGKGSRFCFLLPIKK